MTFHAKIYLKSGGRFNNNLYRSKILLVTGLAAGLYLASFSHNALAVNTTATPLTATISIDPDTSTGQVNRGVLGNNLMVSDTTFQDTQSNRGGGVWNPVTQSPVPEFVNLTKEAGISYLRWPGGDLSRTLNWKKMVGPLTNRPQQQFGLPEYLAYCAAVGANPVITIATSVGNPNDAADLVEYLNAPADNSNPNGGTDWAALRSADGHTAPWNVVWFEYGNEEFNTPRSLDVYVSNYSLYRTAMKAVAPNIKLGAVFEDSTNVKNGWTYTVLQRLGQKIDFGIVHPYFPKLNQAAALKFTPEQVQLAAISADADLTYRLDLYNSLIKQVTGRTDLALVVTEYNSLFVQNNPVPYRQTLVNALHNADFLRILLKPTSNVLFANFWHFANSYWGMVTGFTHLGQTPVKQANHYVFALYNKYLGAQLVKMDTQSTPIDFSGGLGISPRIGVATTQSAPEPVRINPAWWLSTFTAGSQSQSNGVVKVNFNNTDVDYWHASKYFNIEPNTLYRATVNVRTTRIVGGKIGIAVQDGRGWNTMYDQPSNLFLTGSKPWTPVTVEYRTVADAQTMHIMGRRLGGQGPISGSAEFGTFTLEKITQNLGAVESIVGTASKSTDNNELNLVLINKNLNNPVDTFLQINGNFRSVQAESLTGVSPLSTNLVTGATNQVTVTSNMVAQSAAGTLSIQLPAASVTGIKLVRN
jgi:alpha-N-arabinofuranosidase